MPETLRSLVHPWECDSVEHFTTAFYYQAFSAAEWHLLQRAGLGAEQISGLRPVACSTRFARELRAGDAYHIESGLFGHDPDGITVGHRLFNSEDGGLCATSTHRLEGVVPPVEPAHAIEWQDEEPGAEIDYTAQARWSTTSMSVVRERDLDHTGRLGMSALIHHASDASVQFQNRIGMTSSYMVDEKIGYATFAYRIRIHDLPRQPGTVLRTDSALARLGRSSLWFAHRTVDGATGRTLVETSQFGVHLDRAARKAKEIPPGVRETMAAFAP